jgi:hypothetical protein
VPGSLGLSARDGAFAAESSLSGNVSLLLALLVVVAFAFIVERTRLPAHVGDAVRRARGSYSVLSDRSMTDGEKERRLREEAFRLFVLLGRICFGSLLALGLPLGVLWVLDRMGLISLSEVLGVLMRLEFLISVGAIGMLTAWWVGRRHR